MCCQSSEPASVLRLHFGLFSPILPGSTDQKDTERIRHQKRLLTRSGMGGEREREVVSFLLYHFLQVCRFLVELNQANGDKLKIPSWLNLRWLTGLKTWSLIRHLQCSKSTFAYRSIWITVPSVACCIWCVFPIRSGGFIHCGRCFFWLVFTLDQLEWRQFFLPQTC